MAEIEIRDVNNDDAEDLLNIYLPYVTDTAVTFEIMAPGIEEFKRRIIKIKERYPYIKLVENGKTKGYAYAYIFKDREAYNISCETTIYLDKASKRRGFGKRLYSCLEERLKEMGIKNMYACIAVTDDPEDPYLNSDSVYFHSALGFKLCGKFSDCALKFERKYGMVFMEKII